MMKLGLRLKNLKKRWKFFLINKIYAGTRKYEKKRKLLISLGFEIGEQTKIVGPIFCAGELKVGKNCWIGKNFNVNGNGKVFIGDNCDIGPEVIFQTGGHAIGPAIRRAGAGDNYSQFVGSGTWIGGRVTVLNETKIGNSCVIAGCACVTKDIPDNTLAGGVPARVIRILGDEETKQYK